MNIGCVIYKNNVQSRGLTVEWQFKNEDKLVGVTGIATARSGINCAVGYEITYYAGYTNNGIYDLTLKEESNYYVLTRYQNDQLAYSGIGMLNGPFLVAGWKFSEMKD